MLHIATVHWQNEGWIDIQLRYLRRHLPEPYRVYAFLNGIPDGHGDKFFYAATEPIKEHAVKLNRLAETITQASRDDGDLLLFLDGDAFPIADIMPLLRQGLGTHPLLAVQRLENNGDRQPHPCFCATTVGFWKSIAGDWNEGYSWIDRTGNATTDVGGNLLGILEKRGLAWQPLLRTNHRNLHPLWFGIYGGAVYHHGAGFRRDKVSRADLLSLAEARRQLGAAGRIAATTFDYLLRKSPIRALRAHTAVERLSRKNSRLSEELFERIRRDEHFYRFLQQ